MFVLPLCGCHDKEKERAAQAAAQAQAKSNVIGTIDDRLAQLARLRKIVKDHTDFVFAHGTTDEKIEAAGEAAKDIGAYDKEEAELKIHRAEALAKGLCRN